MDIARMKQPKYREIRQGLRLLCGHSRNCTGGLGTVTRVPPQFAPVTGFVLTLNAACHSDPCEGGKEYAYWMLSDWAFRNRRLNPRRPRHYPMPNLFVNGEGGGAPSVFAFAGDEIVDIAAGLDMQPHRPMRLGNGRTAFKSSLIMAGPYTAQSHVAIECPVCHYPSEVDWEKIELEVPSAHVA